MRFTALELPGSWRIDLDLIPDERGWFARTYCPDELMAHGIDPAIAQENTSHTLRAGTLRGMHLQLEPHAEGKHVCCTRGRVYDVLVDLRRDSPTHGRWIGLELSAENRTTLFAPAGLAHGFLTLTDDVEVEYRMTAPYDAASASGVRWDDPAFGIEWPDRPLLISQRDRSWPDYQG